jgi:membrane-associated phospholipid phosphatase
VRPHTRWLVATAVLAIGVYVLMWAGYAYHWTWLSRIDEWALEPAHRFGEAHPGWVTGWDVYCLVLGPFAFRIAVFVVIVVAFVKRNVRLALFLIASVELSGLVTEIAKRLVDRPRPDSALVSAYSSSFPSGHALGVLAAVAALLAVALPVIRPALRARLIALGVVVIVTIGIGRVVLNVHHPSDVIAGWALGYAYFVACLLLISPRQPVTQPDETPVAPGIAR